MRERQEARVVQEEGVQRWGVGCAEKTVAGESRRSS